MQKKIRLLDLISWKFNFIWLCSKKKTSRNSETIVLTVKSMNLSSFLLYFAHPGHLCYLQPNNQFSHFRCIIRFDILWIAHSLTHTMALITGAIYERMFASLFKYRRIIIETAHRFRTGKPLKWGQSTNSIEINPLRLGIFVCACACERTHLCRKFKKQHPSHFPLSKLADSRHWLIHTL